MNIEFELRLTWIEADQLRCLLGSDLKARLEPRQPYFGLSPSGDDQRLLVRVDELPTPASIGCMRTLNAR